MHSVIPADRRGTSPSLRHLKLFETVARLKSVRRASDEFHLSQPAVTQAIAKLESQVGAHLFKRCASGSFLNNYGQIFHRRTERLFAQIEQALTALGVPASQPFLSSRISRSQIRSLISIVENGSFARAARALEVSQASLHRAARELERSLRKPLYHQTAAGVIATPAAVEFARRLKLALREVDLGLEELRAAQGTVGGRVVIGVLLLTGSFLLPNILNDFVTANPTASIRVSTGNSNSMLRNLRAGDVDFVIGLLRDPLPQDLAHEALIEAPYVVVGRHGHPLCLRRNASLDDLVDYDWVVASPGASRRVCYDALFAGRRAPAARIETYSLPVIRALLENSDRLALLTSYELMNADDALTAIPFGPITPVHSIGVTVRRDWLPTQLQASFLDILRARLGHPSLTSKAMLRAV